MPKKIVLFSYLIAGVSFWAALHWRWPGLEFTAVTFVILALLSTYDYLQKRHSILRNYPILGHMRFLLESIRPEIQQYFIESYENGKPFSREARSAVYERAKSVSDSVPFGTQQDLYQVGREWFEHSIQPATALEAEPRIKIGGPECTRPYLASVFNISAMSYGALGRNAVRALGHGAKAGGFYQNTGEGGLTPYHLETGADIVWQIGTGYFGCRTPEGAFDVAKFREKATLPQVVMVEIKISQGAKPGHGGVLPAAKVSEEIAQIRGVPVGKTVISPGGHTAFTSPRGLLEFVQLLRRESEGKPVGFKLCIGKRREFLAICKAMVETRILPDFITVDGAEGGTGAAPLEFVNDMGTPLLEGLVFTHNALQGVGLRDKIRVIASGKVTNGFDLAAKLAAGADLCNCARGMMFAIGCIQALRCQTNQCPTGVATQDPTLERGLVVADKSVRVANFHRNTVRSFLDVIAALGCRHPRDLKPEDLQRRTGPLEVKNYAQIFKYLEKEALLKEAAPEEWLKPWREARAEAF